MSEGDADLGRALAALRAAVAPWLVPGLTPLAAGGPGPLAGAWLASQAQDVGRAARDEGSPLPAAGPGARPPDDRGWATSSAPDPEQGRRLIALVELARGGDSEAFGQLFDHYHTSVYRFVYYRVGSTSLAEDLTSETFIKALRAMGTFRWQGKDFGAWLMTIARNLTMDHFKSGRTRLELVTEDMSAHDAAVDGPESAVLESLTNEELLGALARLPDEQRECLVMRFLQGWSIAETAAVLGRSDGAVKQLQLRAVRALAKLLPEGER